jgi:hypothetical protein
LSLGLLVSACPIALSQPLSADQVSALEGPDNRCQVSTESLLAEMTDLYRLTRLPDPVYTTKQFSSYDRASKSPSENWFANGDRGNYLRVEEKDGRKEHVMMDARGPGAIVRIWSANPRGTLRIYVDRQEAPVIQAEMKKLLGGEDPMFPKPLAGMRSAGWNLYFPILYSTHCKVTSDEGDFYYLLDYRTFEPGTLVENFDPRRIKRAGKQIKAVAKRLASPREVGAPPAESEKLDFGVKLEGGEQTMFAHLAGPRAICEFAVRISAKDIPEALRNVVLYMSFDGEQTVECPLGDFFGTAPGQNPYASLPLGITRADNPEMWCHWRMPFGKTARIWARNFGKQAVQVQGQVAHVAYDFNPADSLLFHAKWRIQRDLPSKPFIDWTHLACSGRGRFVGGALYILMPIRDWWGEGDEKIYVDGETFPSFFGTGTEDYYGYAWCSPELFVHAYHNQPRVDGPGNYGNSSVNRFHIIDDIPFQTSLKFDIENCYNSADSTTRATVSYWYTLAGGDDFFEPITKDDIWLAKVPPYQKPKVAGALEGEEMTIIARSGGITEIQELGNEFSNDTHLWWPHGRPGDKLILGFNAEDNSRKKVIARLTKAVDYGQVQLYVNGQKAGEVIDLFNRGVVPNNEVELGAFDLNKGQNQLTAEIVGRNEAATNYCFGIDYLLLK